MARFEGRGPVDIQLARAARLEREADRETWGVVQGSRGPYFGWVMMYSPEERKKLKAEAATILEAALQVESSIEAGTHDSEQMARYSRPFLTRAGGPPSKSARKRGRW